MKQNIENPRFFYFLCNLGSESFLKEEIRLIYPELRFAFSAPGFLTFKEIRPLGKTLRPIFCRHFGTFIMRGTKDEVLEHAFKINQKEVDFIYSISGEVLKECEIKTNDLVTEVIEVSNQYYLGQFESSILNPPVPGGFFKFVLPDLAPSRAYLKILEAIAYSGVKLAALDHALEIGSAPGGATYALLEKGLTVEGVDPGKMSEVCLNHPQFYHHQTSIQNFLVYQLKKQVQWLLVDINLSPEVSLREIEKVVEKIKPSLKGAFITIKMTKLERVSRVPMYLTFVHNMGLKVIFATQLFSHKQEFLIYAEKY